MRIFDKIMRYSGFIILLAVLTFSLSCSAALRNKQLESVAKDWALVIRATQIIPVYPLSEDLQPGDVMLVSMPIEEQATLYKKKGFLSLDQHMVRLPLESKAFSDFYGNRYGTDVDIVPPAQWQKQNVAGEHNWNVAPHAAFPTYTFSVDAGAGLNLALPLQGVPFALGLMKSGKASGSVTIADSYTFGLDNTYLENKVRIWANENRKLLRNYARHEKQYQYLRVVSRVYVTGRVNITISNDETMGVKGEVGSDRPIEMLGIKEGATRENYVAAIEAMNKLAKEKLPGGAVNIAIATSRSITLTESFGRPLVIGYVGFDMPILEGGRLGVPISTLTQLGGKRSQSIPIHQENVYRLVAFSHMYQALMEIQGAEAKIIQNSLDNCVKILPDKYSFSVYESIKEKPLHKPGDLVDKKSFQDVLAFLGYAELTINTLKNHTDIHEYEQDLQLAQLEYDRLNELLIRESALVQAVDFVFFGN